VQRQSNYPTYLDHDSTVHSQETYDPTYLDYHSTAHPQDHLPSHPPDLRAEDDSATAACSHLETQGHDTTSQIDTQAESTAMDEAVTYELGRWVYETSNENITLAEKLEKSKW
jgi:hypothetical protein